MSRDLRSGTGVGRPVRQEIWLLRPPAFTPRLLYRSRPGLDRPPALAAVAPDASAVLFWPLIDRANSANLDGLPLRLTSLATESPLQLARAMLARQDFLSWCGSRLVIAAGPDRMATLHKSLLLASPPAWRPQVLAPARRLSWITPACSPDGRLVATAAGPNRHDTPFGREARSIWLVSLQAGRAHG